MYRNMNNALNTTVMLLIATSLLLASSVSQTRTDLSGKMVKNEEFTKNLTFSTPDNRTLIIDLVNGSISVRGYDSENVSIFARKKIRAISDKRLKDAERQTSLDIREQLGKLTITQVVPYRLNDGSIEDRTWFTYGYSLTHDISVTLPRKCNLVLKTIEQGEIIVNSIEGDFEVTHINGNITLRNISGSGSVKTSNGKIISTFKENPTRACSFNSINGGITTYFPQDLAATLILKTASGEIFSDFDVEKQSRGTSSEDNTTSTIRREGKKTIYRMNEPVTRTVGNGGPELSFSTMSGNITIRKNK